MKLGVSGDDVLLLQTKLKKFGYFSDKISGYYNQNTLISVSSFQKKVGLKTTGEVNIKTWNRISNFNNKKELDKQEIDNSLITITKNGLKIYGTLESIDFYKETTVKKSIVISNSGLDYNPNSLPYFWKPIYMSIDNKLKRSSHFIIGRESDETNKFDGLVINSIDDKYWSYPFNEDSSRNIISIEICNYGPLIKKDGMFYNLSGNLVNNEEVINLEFLEYDYYHKYTDNQIESLRKLLIHLQLKHRIKIQRGTYDESGLKTFYDDKWFVNQNKEQGIKTRNHFNTSYFGIAPQKELIDMLNTI